MKTLLKLLGLGLETPETCVFTLVSRRFGTVSVDRSPFRQFPCIKFPVVHKEKNQDLLVRVSREVVQQGLFIVYVLDFDTYGTRRVGVRSSGRGNHRGGPRGSGWK